MEEPKNKNNDKAAKDEAGKKEEIAVLSKKEYDALKAKAGERDAFCDKYLRTHAEFENAKKRLEKERADYLKYANETFILDFLPILDSLEIAETHIAEAKDFNAVREGVVMIQDQIQKFLKETGVERVKTIGEKFDPHLHEALETEESGDKDDGVIVAELKPGYSLNGKLLRPASVRIVKKISVK